MVVANWLEKNLEVSPEIIYAFETLSYAMDVELKTKTASKEQFVNKKRIKPKSISFEVPILAVLGVDVQHEIDDWMSYAKQGKKGKFFVGTETGGGPLGDCEYMLESVKANEVRIAPSGEMESAKLSLSFKQASLDGGKKKKKKKKKKQRKPQSPSSTRQHVRDTITPRPNAGGGGGTPFFRTLG